MIKIICFTFLLISSSFYCNAQVFPKEGNKLNYRIVGFSFPSEPGIENYKIEIANGTYNSEDSFAKNIVVTQTDAANRLIVEVPYFGCQYTWRVVYNKSKSPARKSSLYHFSTGRIPQLDTNFARLWIQKREEKFQDAYIFMDDTRALYDMDGNAVWYLPNVVAGMNDLSQIRDLKITSDGTITFILSDALVPEIFEIKYSGDVIWKGPNDGKVCSDNCEHYHHQFSKLSNGHYMVMGTESVKTKVPGFKPKALPGSTDYNTGANPMEFMIRYGVLIEYDMKGDVVWSWKSSKYFSGSDIMNYRDPISGMPGLEMDANSFYFDEKAKELYISYKNISRIIKVKYPEGAVQNVYGEIFEPDVPAKGNGLFAGQHSCGISGAGNLYLYSDMVNKKNSASEILVMKESSTLNNTLELVWKYECPADKAAQKGKQDHLPGVVKTGGNVTELPDRSYFVSECNPDGYLFIVNEDKEVLFKAQPIRVNTVQNLWEPFPQNKANIIPSRKAFEDLVMKH